MSTSITELPGRSAGSTAWRTIGTVLTVVVLLLAGLVTWALLAPQRTDEQSNTYRQPVSRLVLDTSEGDVTVAAGEAGVVVVEHHLAWTSMSRPSVDQSLSGQTLAVDGRCPGTVSGLRFGLDCAIDYTVQVPPEVAVEVRTGAGTVQIGDLTGEVRVTASTGGILLDGLAGPLWVESGSGDVTGTRLRSGVVDVQTGSGDLELAFAEPTSAIRASTGAGDVVIGLAGGRYQVSAESDAGAETVEVTTDPAALATVTARSGAGDVLIRYAG